MVLNLLRIDNISDVEKLRLALVSLREDAQEALGFLDFDEPRISNQVISFSGAVLLVLAESH